RTFMASVPHVPSNGQGLAALLARVTSMDRYSFDLVMPFTSATGQRRRLHPLLDGAYTGACEFHSLPWTIDTNELSAHICLCGYSIVDTLRQCGEIKIERADNNTCMVGLPTM